MCYNFLKWKIIRIIGSNKKNKKVGNTNGKQVGKSKYRKIRHKRWDNKKIQDEQIYTLGELCRKTRTSLINMKIDKKIVDDIEIQLQLMGLMLKGSI